MLNYRTIGDSFVIELIISMQTCDIIISIEVVTGLLAPSCEVKPSELRTDSAVDLKQSISKSIVEKIIMKDFIFHPRNILLLLHDGRV